MTWRKRLGFCFLNIVLFVFTSNKNGQVISLIDLFLFIDAELARAHVDEEKESAPGQSKNES
jgi:hypothetical protein